MTEIFKQHSRWINIVKQFGIDFLAEDIVQEAYIKCLDKPAVNDAYFFLTLRSLSFDYLRKQKKIIKIPIDEVILEVEIFKENEIINIVDNFYWFDKEIFYLYYDHKLSMRKIAELTGISLKTIFNTITNCNNKIKKICQEEENQKD